MNIFIPQANPKANYFVHKKEIDLAIKKVLNSGKYILGDEVSRFENKLAVFVGVRHALGVANGTEALYTALLACGIGNNDAVITVANTAVATVAAIKMAGAIPVLVDVDPESFTLDPVCLQEAIRNYRGKLSLKAVIPVHLYGLPADMKGILKVAKKFKLLVIEDCAQALGAAIEGKKVGTWGDVSAFSFYPTKNLGALGDGGAVLTNNLKIAQKLRLLREYGWEKRYISKISGINSRLDELQASILNVKLRYLPSENSARFKLARLYTRLLSGLPICLPKVSLGLEHVFHQYVIRTNKRDLLRSFLAFHKIGSSIHYPVPIHLQPAYWGSLLQNKKGLPVTERLASEILSLPVYPELGIFNVKKICNIVKRFFCVK